MAGKRRLTNPPARLAAMPSRFASMPAVNDEAARSRYRNQSAPWRKWYSLKRWRDLRVVILDRDGHTCTKTGVLLTGGRSKPNSAVVDHKIRHNGDPVLFWDPNNLQAVSKAYHDSEKQRQEAAAAYL